MNSKYKFLQRRLRSTMPAPEVVLWTYIRNNQLGIKFRRQYAIENRIFDFYAPSIKLGIEVDGETHFLRPDQQHVEQQADQVLSQRHGITILRVLNSDVIRNLDGVLLILDDKIKGLQRQHFWEM